MNVEKFKAYWESIGNPELECKNIGMDYWVKPENPPTFTADLYRIKGDPNWEVRQQWIESDFKLRVEMEINNGEWIDTSGDGYKPDWDPTIMYRIAPGQEKEKMNDEITKKRYRTRSGRRAGIYSIGNGGDYPVHGWIESPDKSCKLVYLFKNDLKFMRGDSEHDLDLFEVSKYDDIPIDQKGYAIMWNGDKHKRHFAGVSPKGLPMAWESVGTSWTVNNKTEWKDFIPVYDDDEKNA